jgi:ketosteroid isomerase-like protein
MESEMRRYGAMSRYAPSDNSNGGGEVMGETRDIAAVKEAVAGAFAASRAKDAVAWRRLVCPDAFGFHYGAGLLAESAPGEELYEAINAWFAGGMTSSMVPTHIEVRLLGSDAAIATFYIQGSETYPDGRSIDGAWRGTTVLVRDGGKWRNLHYHYSPLTTTQTERRG